MSALKKTSVAAMIMVVCIVMAIVIGEARKDTFIQASGEQQVEDSIVYNWSTIGNIKNTIKENAQNVFGADEATEEQDGGITLGKLIGIAVVALILISILGKKK